jgi:hypothetical protein
VVFVRDGHWISIDKERGISIESTVRPWSDTDPLVHGFIYKNPDITFFFGAVSREETRTFFKTNRQVERSVCIAMEVFEPSIESGIRSSKHRPPSPLPPKKLDEIKAAIKEGIFELCASRDLKDGSLLAPDFQVTFVSHIDFITTNTSNQ